MWPFRKKWKFVGLAQVGLTETSRITNKTTQHTYPIHFWMTDRGERKALLVCTNADHEKWILEKSKDWIDALSWERGGPFPPKFKECDPIKDMLLRLVDKSMGISDET